MWLNGITFGFVEGENKMVDLWQGIFNGFAAGIGVGVANWVFVRRLEHIEKTARKAITEMQEKIRRMNGHKKKKGREKK